MIIDIHAHIGDSDNPAASMLQKGCTAELAIKLADQAGIDVTVVFPTQYLDYMDGNRVIAEAVGRYPDRLIGFARADVKHDNAVASFKHGVEELGLRGLKMVPRGEDFANPALFELMDLCAEYDVPTIMCSATVTAELIELAGKFPRTRFIMGHMGAYIACYDHLQFIQAAEEKSNVWLEPSTVLTQVTLKEAGAKVPDRLVFGSDGPALNPKAELEKIRAMAFSEETLQKVLCDNAKEVLGVSW